MSLTVNWHQVPVEVREIVRPLLDDCLWLLPCWCLTLHVNWQAQHEKGEEIPSSCNQVPEYRFASIWIHGSWLEGDDDQRRSHLLHEILHMALAPLVKGHQADIDRFFGNRKPKFRAKVEDEHRQRYEGCICDLTLAIDQLDALKLPRTTYREEIT